ncbi:amino acid permease-domain-containing protein [Aspergillus crustosus]
MVCSPATEARLMRANEDDRHAILLQPTGTGDNDGDGDDRGDDRGEDRGDPLRPQRHLGLLTNRMIGTAIFSVPSAIATSVGSAGAALALWLVGLVLAYGGGLLIWIELASLMPRSGGEKVYRDAAYPKPAMLVTTVFAVHVIFLGFTGDCPGVCVGVSKWCIGIGSVVVAENILLALDRSAQRLGEESPCGCRTRAVIAAIHIKSSALGNILASVKILILVVIILSGLRALRGDLPHVQDPASSLKHPFAGSSSHVAHYTNALFKILATYQGWSNAAYVLDEVQNPRKVLKVAGIVGVGIVGLLYILTNFAYFIVATAEELSKTGVTVVVLPIGRVFGDTMLWLTAVRTRPSFANSRTTLDIEKDAVIRLPNDVNAALVLISLLRQHPLDLPPAREVYNLLLDVGQYAIAIINLLVVLGLFIIRRSSHRGTFRAWTSVILIFLASQLFLFITPAALDSQRKLPPWLYSVVAILVLSGGAVSWLVSWVVLPRRGNFVWTARKSILSDGSSGLVGQGSAKLNFVPHRVCLPHAALDSHVITRVKTSELNQSNLQIHLLLPHLQQTTVQPFIYSPD